MLKLKVNLIHEEFERVRKELDKDDIAGQETVKELLNILKDGKTVAVLDKANEMKHKMIEEAEASSSADWDFGTSLHFVSSVFTTLGYGHSFPETPGKELQNEFLGYWVMVQTISWSLCVSNGQVGIFLNWLIVGQTQILILCVD